MNERDKHSADASFFFFYFISLAFVLWLFSTSMRFNFLEMSKKLNDLKPTTAHVPKVLLCPNATGEEDDKDNCIHCMMLTPSQVGNKDHKTKIVWCGTRLRRVFVRESSRGSSSNPRHYQTIGWFCSKCDKVLTVKEYKRLESEKHTCEDRYKQRRDEYWKFVRERGGYGTGDWWDWLIKERERLGWVYVERENKGDHLNYDKNFGVTWGWLPRNSLTDEQRVRISSPP